MIKAAKEEFVNSPIRVIAKWWFERSLQRTGPVNTFRRVCTSGHVRDLQWIASWAILFWLLSIGLFVAVYFFTPSAGHEFLSTCVTGLTAALAAVLTWAYQTGSNRLGTVDLFGCEISVLCRVFLVVDFAHGSVSRFAIPPHEAGAQKEKPKKFTSEEHYTPVYDETLSDLQPLAANVVTSVTEFYTYRKTMTDYLRRIAEEDIGSPAYKYCNLQMIYMQFLMYESAHKAVEELIEFEPNRAESLINIYCSELVVYQFLLHNIPEEDPHTPGQPDCRHQRLLLRDRYYRRKVKILYNSTMDQDEDPFHHWGRAQTSADELRSRFLKVFPDEADKMRRRNTLVINREEEKKAGRTDTERS